MKTTGLTLKEAIDSGKPFRLNGKEMYYSSALPYMYEALSSDWQIKVKDTFTRDELMRALAATCKHYESSTYLYKDHLSSEAIELGLKEAERDV